jgi:hypothetical protein
LVAGRFDKKDVMPPAKKITKRTAKASGKKAAKRRGPAKMTAAHKQALAVGREESRHVAAYLDALDAHRPKRGRRRTPDSIKARLAEIDAMIGDARGIKKLELAQSKLDLQAELAAKDAVVDLTQLRKKFLEHAAAYGDRKGISYAAWRSTGVPATDLKAAGVARTRG